ncbi:CO/xanthine dehydrogenase Mo-binding subunit [Povalibacter uvarum]|uniref:CO/xanthine dehydrogenase Mo-binding subunit n=1 Tax=Povalibacter uvarum TaxID=732238 RepID=A0A841HPX2_9GAMM|nr:molybdopterin cofactor-binding domain-containing protein [Povalibacter uvarum]MBB6095237.1 CO/xanthine dehydrogenase Mo-binding subunit [Povalibacter uvarum]
MTQVPLTRRQFAQILLVGGIGLAFVGCKAAPQRVLAPQWWVELHGNGRILMLTSRVEMGQGAHTGLRTLLAEELDVDPRRIEIVQVPSDPRFGMILTGGSYTVAGWQDRMRRAGATARSMLLQAAATRWTVPITELSTFDAEITHRPTGRKIAYNELVDEAAALTPPAAEAVSLKTPETWRYIGRPGRVAHHEEIIAGRAAYGIDKRLPGLCFAVLVRAPVLGAKLARFDDSAALRTPGFIATVAQPGNAWPSTDHVRDAVAVVAEDSWSAQRAREALRVEWTQPSTVTPSPLEALARLCNEPGIVSLERGQIDGGRTIAAEYRQPFLAHVPMEPPNATAHIVDDRIEVWCGNQRQTRLKDAIVRELGFAPEKVVVHSCLIGGSFGRRLEIDYGLEAARLAKSLRRPVQVLWTREDDVQFGLYRSASVHRLRARIDASRRLVSFEHRCAAESVLRQQEPSQIDAAGADWTIATPLVSLLYDVPNIRIEHRAAKPMTPCAWWRGTYWNNVTTAVECFMDEAAQQCGHDPLEFRLRHLHAQPQSFVVNAETRVTFDPKRMRQVLTSLADRAGWRRPPDKDVVRGLACGIYDSPECHAAVITEMTLRDGTPTLLKATVAVDVGTVINPGIVEAQAISGFVMGASAALHERVSLQGGAVEQRSFADYRLLRMNECPSVEVVLVPSDSGICGIGEIVTPAAMAAVSNAASRLLGRRIRTWPILGA